MEVKTLSPQQTINFAKEFAHTLKPGDVLALFGDLGAGKTVFVKGLVAGLGIKQKVTSPTFVFCKIYRNDNLTVYHIDLYRGEKISDFTQLGLDEIFAEDAITVIEWSERLKDKLPKKRIDINIEKIDEKTRKISIEKH